MKISTATIGESNLINSLEKGEFQCENVKKNLKIIGIALAALAYLSVAVAVGAFAIISWPISTPILLLFSAIMIAPFAFAFAARK